MVHRCQKQAVGKNNPSTIVREHLKLDGIMVADSQSQFIIQTEEVLEVKNTHRFFDDSSAFEFPALRYNEPVISTIAISRCYVCIVRNEPIPIPHIAESNLRPILLWHVSATRI